MPPSESRASAELLLGRVLARSGSAGRARDVLLDAAARSTYAPSTRCRLLSEAVIPTLRSGDPAAAIETGRSALALAAPGSPEELPALVALGTALAFAGELAEARVLVLRGRELASTEAPEPPPALRSYIGLALRLVGERGAAREELEQVIGAARSNGSVSALPYALVRLADVELEDGNWQAAATQLAEAANLGRETGQAADRGLAVAGLAWLAAVRGDESDCRRFAAQALELADRLGAGSRLHLALPALGLLELGRGDNAAAAAHLCEARQEQRTSGWCDAAFQPDKTPDLVEALLGAGEPAAAAAELSAFDSEARRAGAASAIAAAARCRGMPGPDEELDHWFQIALEPGPQHRRALRGGADATGVRRTADPGGSRWRRRPAPVHRRNHVRQTGRRAMATARGARTRTTVTPEP